MQPNKITKTNNNDKDNFLLLKKNLQDGFLALKLNFAKNPNITHLFKQHCKLIDKLLVQLWAELHVDASCCLIAVGGYGRGELYPHSDIDLLILVPEQSQDNTKLSREIELLIGSMWDLGLNVGHSVRSLSECIIEAQKDITVQTNLLESRLLSGDGALYQQFLKDAHKLADPTAFFEAKIKEQDQRYAKYNDTAYNLEPNIKESPGGLRDLHMIAWLARTLNLNSNSRSGGNIWNLLTRHHVISAKEARLIRFHEKITVHTYSLAFLEQSQRRPPAV